MSIIGNVWENQTWVLELAKNLLERKEAKLPLISNKSLLNQLTFKIKIILVI